MIIVSGAARHWRGASETYARINWLFTKITPTSYTTSREPYLGITRHRPARVLVGARRLRAAPVRSARPLAEVAELLLDFRCRVEHVHNTGPRLIRTVL